MKKISVVGFILLGVFVLGGGAHAEIYKWVDENGKVHFSDRKIVTEAKKVNVKTGSTDSVQSSDSNQNQVDETADNSIELRLLEKQKYVNFLKSERLERKEKREEARAEKEKQKKLCAAMQGKLQSYNQGNFRWYELDESTGERVYVPDDQVEARKIKLQSEINSNC